MAVLAAYDRHGTAWARARAAEPIGNTWLDRLCALLPAGGTVLDIGCGAGIPIARQLSARGFRVTGVDGSPVMLGLFRRNLPGVPAALADMRSLALGRRFDGLIAWDSLFHLSPEDQRPMFPRLAAHAAPGAALLFTSGSSEGSAMGELEGDPLYHGSLGPDEYRALLAAAAFAVVGHAVADPGCGHRTVWLARRPA